MFMPTFPCCRLQYQWMDVAHRVSWKTCHGGTAMMKAPTSSIMNHSPFNRVNFKLPNTVWPKQPHRPGLVVHLQTHTYTVIMSKAVA